MESTPQCTTCGAELAGGSPADVCPRCLLSLGLPSDGPTPTEHPRILHYEILEELGRGGMGRVFLAVDTVLRRKVALKFLHPESEFQPLSRRRLFREARAAAALDHPYICHIHEIREDDDYAFIAMEYIQGETLEERMKKGPIPRQDFFRIAIQICEALTEAHSRGIVHRDLKPSNVMWTVQGHAKVMDFGLARQVDAATKDELTATGVIPGTPAYMSPDQILGNQLAPRSDVFSLGILFAELLTGVHPFRRDNLADTTIAILREAPRFDDEFGVKEPALKDLILRMLEKQPSDRPKIHEVARLLQDLSSEDLIRAAPTSPDGPAVPAHRKPLLWAFAALALALALTALLWPVRLGSTPDVPRIPQLGNVRRLLSLPGPETQPTWSPDGNFLAFVYPDSSGNKDIWVQGLGGGRPIQITRGPGDDYDPDWSPDGSKIVFRSSRTHGGLFTVTAPFGGDEQRVSDFGYRPRWSPDGTRILFQLRKDRSTPNEIYVLDYPVRGSAEKLLSWEGIDPYHSAEWSPDGEYLICMSGLYVAGSGLLMVPLDSPEKPFYLEVGEDKVVGYNPVWTSDARGVAFASLRGGISSLWYLSLDEDHRPAAPAGPLTSGELDDFPAFSPDGMRLAYSSGSSQSDIWKVELDLDTGLPIGDPLRVIRSPAPEDTPRVLPDDRHFLFISDRENQRFLYVADLDGGNVRLVDRSRNWSDWMSISPDGSWIAIAKRDPIESYLLPFDPVRLETTGPPEKLEGPSPSVAMNWSADGRYLLRASLGGQLQLWQFGEKRELVTWPLDSNFHESYPRVIYSSFSPDGTWIAFGAYKERHRPSVFVLRVGEETPTLAWEGSGTPMWLADPRRLYIWSERGDETESRFGFVSFDPRTGEVTSDFQILAIQPAAGVPTYNRASFSLTGDRKWLFFAFTEEEAEIYLADLRW